MEDFSPLTKELMDKAWAIRVQNFPPEIEFDYPQATEAITLTENNCALDCAHCGGHYLKGMKSVKQISRTRLSSKNSHSSKTKSYLISGGCNHQGKVPFQLQIPFLEEIKQGRKLNFHVGLVNEIEADQLSELADVVSFDFVSDDETIQEVYGLNRKAEDYLYSYRVLRQRVKVLPHICIGLKGGKLAGEYKSLELLQQEGTDGLVFIVFIPTLGSRYEAKEPPLLEEVVKILAEARLSFPDKPIFLGCMRPKGRYRQALDLAAIRCGVNKIVVPTRAAVKLSEELGLNIRLGEECCAL